MLLARTSAEVALVSLHIWMRSKSPQGLNRSDTSLCEPDLQSSTEQTVMQFALSCAAMPLCWLTAQLYDQQMIKGVRQWHLPAVSLSPFTFFPQCISLRGGLSQSQNLLQVHSFVSNNVFLGWWLWSPVGVVLLTVFPGADCCFDAFCLWVALASMLCYLVYGRVCCCDHRGPTCSLL